MRSKLISLTIFLTFLGFITFVVCLVYKIYAAASWNFITGVLNFLTTHIIFLKLRCRLIQWYGLPELESFIRLGFVFISIAMIGAAYHLAYYCLTLYHSLDATISLWLPILCSLGTALSGLLLCFWVNREQREL